MILNPKSIYYDLKNVNLDYLVKTVEDEARKLTQSYSAIPEQTHKQTAKEMMTKVTADCIEYTLENS